MFFFIYVCQIWATSVSYIILFKSHRQVYRRNSSNNYDYDIYKKNIDDNNNNNNNDDNDNYYNNDSNKNNTTNNNNDNNNSDSNNDEMKIIIIVLIINIYVQCYNIIITFLVLKCGNSILR